MTTFPALSIPLYPGLNPDIGHWSTSFSHFEASDPTFITMFEAPNRCELFDFASTLFHF